MDGFGSHTFQWVDAEGSPVWVKYHFKTDQGVKCLDSSSRRVGRLTRTATNSTWSRPSTAMTCRRGP